MRTVLFLNESYIESFDELRQLMLSHNGKSKKSKCFGKELLGLCDDGILEKWLIEHYCQQMANDLSLELKAPNLSDSNKIAIVYKIIAGIECKIDFESEFFEMAELLGYEKNGKTLPFENKDHPEARIDDTNSEVKFVFKAIEDIDTPLYFALRKIGVYSVVGEGFSIGEPGLTAMMINTINSSDEFSVSFSFEDISVMDRKGKYLLKLLGKKSELICELVYDVKEETFVKLSGYTSKSFRRYCESSIEEKFVKLGDNGKVPLYYVGILPIMGETNFWVLDNEKLYIKIINYKFYPFYPKIDEYDGTKTDFVTKYLDNLNKTVKKDSFRLLNKNELRAYFRWSTFWDDNDLISIGFYFVFKSGDAIKFCNVDLEDVENPPFYLMYFVYEEN